jgi:ribosomal protein S18 acetylase RimI-like enzyme
MNAWPSLQTILYDGWVLRMARGYTKRANSINPLYPAKLDVEEKISHCEKLYARFALPAIFKLVECKKHDFLNKKLETLGYERLDVTSVQVNTGLKITDRLSNSIVVSDDFTDAWINGFVECNKIKTQDVETVKAMLRNITGQKIALYKMGEGGVIACGYGVLEHGYVGLFDIVVKSSERGKGYGKEIVTSILSEAKKSGAQRSYLQVVNSNAVAKNLYEKLGYKEQYKYFYRASVL